MRHVRPPSHTPEPQPAPPPDHAPHIRYHVLQPEQPGSQCHSPGIAAVDHICAKASVHPARPRWRRRRPAAVTQRPPGGTPGPPRLPRCAPAAAAPAAAPRLPEDVRKKNQLLWTPLCTMQHGFTGDLHLVGQLADELAGCTAASLHRAAGCSTAFCRGRLSATALTVQRCCASTLPPAVEQVDCRHGRIVAINDLA